MDKSHLFGIKYFPTGIRQRIPFGVIQGIALWIIMFVPLVTLAIQAKLDSLVTMATNENFKNIAFHFILKDCIQ